MATAPAQPKVLPDGPRLGRFEQSLRFHRDPLGFLRECRERHGHLFTINLPVIGPAVVVTDPREIGAVVGIEKSRGHAGEARRGIVGMIAEDSVLGADEDAHTRARGSIRAAFEPDAIGHHLPLMWEIAESHVGRWPAGRPFRLLDRMRKIADDIFVRCLIGVRDERRAEAMSLAIRRVIRSPGNPPMPVPNERAGLAGRGTLALFERRIRPLVRLIEEEVVERRVSGRDQGDLLDLLREGTGDDVRAMADELIPLTMAGQEPGASGLTWLLDRLLRDAPNPAGLARAYGPDPLLDPFVKEAYRLRPPVHSVARRLTEPLDLGGAEIPAGTVAMVPMVLVHRDPGLFPDPDEFRPGRFGAGPEEELPLLPFGGGARRCLGEALAKAELATVVPVVLGGARLAPVMPETERMVVRGTVTVPVRSGLVRRDG